MSVVVVVSFAAAVAAVTPETPPTPAMALGAQWLAAVVDQTHGKPVDRETANFWPRVDDDAADDIAVAAERRSWLTAFDVGMLAGEDATLVVAGACAGKADGAAQVLLSGKGGKKLSVVDVAFAPAPLAAGRLLPLVELKPRADKRAVAKAIKAKGCAPYAPSPTTPTPAAPQKALACTGPAGAASAAEQMYALLAKRERDTLALLPVPFRDDGPWKTILTTGALEGAGRIYAWSIERPAKVVVDAVVKEVVDDKGARVEASVVLHGDDGGMWITLHDVPSGTPAADGLRANAGGCAINSVPLGWLKKDGTVDERAAADAANNPLGWRVTRLHKTGAAWTVVDGKAGK